MEKKMTSIGGQAIIEGVMMRGPRKTAIAVRKPDGEIIVEEKPSNGIGIWSKIPIVRGVVSFFSSMVIGVKALMFSAKFFDVEEDKNEKDKNQNGLPEWALYLSVIFSLFLSIGMFIILPNLIANFVVPNKEAHAVLYNFIESVIKLIIFGVYIVLISKMKDIQRVFEYHGAEHKSIFCYENGEELTVENVRKFSRFHPRCGTSFLLFVIIISILIYSLIGVYSNPFINIGLRLLLLPIVAGVSYEIIKFAGRSKSKWITWLNEPGKWLQRFTTREPDDSQIEVAIASLKAVIPDNPNEDKW